MNTLKMNFGEILTREQMNSVVGGTPPFRCQLMNGTIVDCYAESASECIDTIEAADPEGDVIDIFGCWDTTPLD